LVVREIHRRSLKQSRVLFFFLGWQRRKVIF
jgi:hypothetical protein